MGVKCLAYIRTQRIVPARVQTRTHARSRVQRTNYLDPRTSQLLAMLTTKILATIFLTAKCSDILVLPQVWHIVMWLA